MTKPKDQEEVLSTQEIMEIWEHFANTGGQDKDRMVTIMTLLVPVLTGTIGYAYLKKDGIAALIGFMSSTIAVLVVLMYGGYANYNWKKADEIAKNYLSKVKLKKLETEVDESLSHLLIPDYYKCILRSKAHKIANCLSRPHNPDKRLAPIFSLFLYLSTFTGLASLILIILFWPAQP